MCKIIYFLGTFFKYFIMPIIVFYVMHRYANVCLNSIFTSSAQLTHLDVSKNNISKFSAVENWKSPLIKLNLNNNSLGEATPRNLVKTLSVWVNSYQDIIIFPHSDSVYRLATNSFHFWIWFCFLKITFLLLSLKLFSMIISWKFFLGFYNKVVFNF